MCLALPWGPLGLAVADTVTILVMLYPRMRLSFRDSPITIAAFLAATLEAYRERRRPNSLNQATLAWA